MSRSTVRSIRTGDPVETASRARIFVCRAPDPKEETACASRILSNLARKAFRRPVTDEGPRAADAVLQRGRKTGTFEGGIENAMVAMLSSAKFLYRVEPPPANAKPGSIYRLSDIGTGVAAVVLPVEQHSRR